MAGRARTPRSLSQREARWLALAAQGLGLPRPRTATRRQLGELVARLGAIQLDAINVLDRTQFLVPFSRLGGYQVAQLEALCGPDGTLFEY